MIRWRIVETVTWYRLGVISAVRRLLAVESPLASSLIYAAPMA